MDFVNYAVACSSGEGRVGHDEDFIGCTTLYAQMSIVM